MKANIIKSLRPFLVKHEPDILMYMGLTGLCSSIGLSILGTIKATKRVTDKKNKLKKDKLSIKEMITTVWDCYLPALVLTSVSVPCIICSNNIHNKRNAALAAAYTLSETAMQTYQDKVKEIVGEKKESQIRDEAAKETVSKTYSDSKNSVIMCANGDYLFCDSITGRYFKSTWDKIRSAQNELNARAINGMDQITLNEWYETIGLSRVEYGDERGWGLNVSNSSFGMMGSKGLIEVNCTCIMTEDNVPCAYINYTNKPIDLR